MRHSLRCISNIYRAVISLDREETEEITAEDGFILKIVRKERETHADVDFQTSLTKLPVFVQLVQAICYSEHGTCMVACSGFLLLHVSYVTAPGTTARLIM